jgi:hypothetical protein
MPPPPKPKVAKGFAKIFEPLIAWIVVGTLVGCIVVLVLLSGFSKIDEFPKNVIANVVSEFLAASVLYLVTFTILRKAVQLSREEEFQSQVVDPIVFTLQDSKGHILTALRDNNKTVHPRIKEIVWADLFEGADEILLLVQGWDKWKEKVADHLPAFLEGKGKIQVILHDPLQEDLLQRMAWRRKGDTGTIEQEKEEIEGTLRNLKEATKHYPGQLTCRYTKRMNWFCGIYFRATGCGHGKLLLSIYQHQPTYDLAVEKVPSFLIRTDVFPELGDWFDKEWKHLSNTDNSRPA